MSKESHDRFREWLAVGAEGDPPRDLAVHASVCPECQQSMAAFDRLDAIDPGKAAAPRQALAPDVVAVPAKATRAKALAETNALPKAVAPSKAAAREREVVSRDGLKRVGRRVGALAGVMFSAAILGIGVTQLITVFGGVGVAVVTPTPGQGVLGEHFTPTPEPTPTAVPTATPSPTPVPTPVPTPTPTPIPTPEPTAPPMPGSPGAPRSLTAVVSIGHIALAWSAPSSNGGSPVTRYDLYRDGAGRPFKSVTTRSYTDTVANGSTHQYRVTAVNSVGSSPYSKVATGTTPNVPGIPGNPQAQGGAGQIVLTWLAPTSNGSPITRYDIYRDGASTPTYSVTTLSKTDTGLAAGTTYTYIVKAVNAVGAGTGGSASATTATVPGAPLNLSAIAGAGQIVLTWSAPASDGGSPITRYDIYQDGAATATDATTTPGYTSVGLAAGSFHSYIVRAVNLVGSSAGASDSTTTWDVPSAPISLTATPGVSQIVLTWSAPASAGGSPITRYDIYRNGAGSPTFSVTTLSKTDSGLAAGTTYSYIVKAFNAVGSGPGSYASATTADVPDAPFITSAIGSVGQIALDWSPPASNGSPITRYDIYRDGGYFDTSTSSDYTDSPLGPGASHSYYVKAHNAVGDSAGSNTRSATTADVPDAPFITSAIGSVGQIALDWSPPASNGSPITRYDIYRDGGYFDTSTSSDYTDSPLGPGASHSYYVKAHNAVGDSAGSNTRSATTADVPDAPALIATTGAAGAVDLSWTTPLDGGDAIIGYDLYYADNTFIGTFTGNSTSDTGLAPGNYSYYVVARNSVGPSVHSNTASADAGL